MVFLFAARRDLRPGRARAPRVMRSATAQVTDVGRAVAGAGPRGGDTLLPPHPACPTSAN
ncbi:hypothetical protein CC117_12160 [Parafrankia colletiae]|uniref:Uncharacterized protein n=1 Tax=Parafrankia colletiae TaxID=573497 RepID=A0A1S1R972_9ACTN|nr:hypothetical protein CC117_12160 [Parafrankia colletiae]